MPPGTSWKGPLLGDRRAGGGLLFGVGQGAASEFECDWNIEHEKFIDDVTQIANPGDCMETIGWNYTDVGAPVADDATVSKENRYLYLYPGTTVDTGFNIQHNLAPTAARIPNPHRTIGPITSTATLMDNRDMIWATRMGTAGNATTWSGKIAMGWGVTDGLWMVATTGVLSGINTGGGMGFHIGEDGNIMYFTQRTTFAANFAEVDTGYDVDSPTSAITTTDKGNWMGYGFRAHWLDADSATGNGWVEFYLNPSDTPGAWVKVGTVVDNMPMSSTETYSATYEIANGPVQLFSAGVTDLYTAINKPGRSSR